MERCSVIHIESQIRHRLPIAPRAVARCTVLVVFARRLLMPTAMIRVSRSCGDCSMILAPPKIFLTPSWKIAFSRSRKNTIYINALSRSYSINLTMQL